MNGAKCFFAATAVLLAVMETAESGESSSIVVKEAGLRSDGELVQVKQVPPNDFKSNNDDAHRDTAYKPRLKDALIPRYSTGASIDAKLEPSRVNKRHAKQLEK